MELAQAAVMAALCAAIAIIAVVVPFAAALSLLGSVPMSLLAYRYRLRVLLAAMVAGGLVAFLIAGMGGFMTVVNCASVVGTPSAPMVTTLSDHWLHVRRVRVISGIGWHWPRPVGSAPNWR